MDDRFSAMASCCMRASITLFPTTWTPAATFSRARFSRATGLWAPQCRVAEEGAVHDQIVVLARVDEDVFMGKRIECLDDRGHLDDLWPGPDDRDDAAHGQCARVFEGRY